MALLLLGTCGTTSGFVPAAELTAELMSAVLSDGKLFTPVTHPESGVTVYVLTHRVAPLQKGFYFVGDSNNRFYRGCASSVLDVSNGDS